MADAYSHALLVELEENNVQKLKNKLVKYFQSKKSNGGDCEVDYENGSRTAVLRFRRITLDKGVLKMTVRLLTDDTATQVSGDNETTDDEELCSTSAVLGNIPATLSQEFLEMLVENILKDPDSPSALKSFNLEVVPEISSAVVTFQSGKGTCTWKILTTKVTDVTMVYPFYKSLGTALYGKDKPSIKLPAAISELIDSAVWKYLKDNRSARETINSHLAKHFCNVNLNQSTVCLSPVSLLLQQKDAKALIKEWGDTVKTAFAEALSKFKSLRLPLESEVWEESEKKIRQELLNEDVVVVPDKANGVLSVVGLVADVNKLEQTLREVVNKTFKRWQREKSSVTQEIKVAPSVFHILCQDGLQDKLQRVYPEIKMSFTKDSPDLMVTGLREEIMAASKVIYDAMFALKRENLELDKFVLDWLKDEKQEELTNDLLISNGINATFEINAHRVQLLAASDRDLNDAEDHLGRLLISEYIDVEDSNVLKRKEWEHLVSNLENANNKPCRGIQIHTTGEQVVVSGHKDSVRRVSSALDDFLTQYAEVEETVVVKPNTIVEYIQKHDTRQLEQIKDKVVVFYRKEAICLTGSRVDVEKCKDLVKNMVSSVVFEMLKVSMPGGKKLFQEKEAMYVSSLLSDTGCLVQLVDETSGGQGDLAHSRLPKPVYQLQTADGVEIAVCKADMCSYPVHAVVNSSNQDLKHNGGLAKALLNAAGPQLQVECDKHMNLKGQLKPGDCVITGAGGQLCCQKVIHAVGPQFDQGNPQKALAQLKRAVKGSLELAETHGCISVALPAISRSQGFPLSLCATTIIKAVKEHCDDKYGDNTLKKIHFVNNDDSAVQAMDMAVRQEYGNHGVSHSQQTLANKDTKSPPVKRAKSDSMCLGQVQTKEGMVITVTKGNIENATTEVTVNTVFEDLTLTKGAVSNAIFRVAGPKLQQLVTAKNANGKVGEVIVTDGCQLKSKQVFHAITPHWDNGQGAAEKTLSGLFKDCLDKAEDSGLSSISFPAIGTGNLGFPKNLVASLMLDEILAFSSKKQPKHLKKVVIILYSGDANTIQAFSDEFTKKFPNASGLSVPTSSQQSSGPFSKVVSSSGMHETKMGSVAIQVVTGDITKETTDVIVNSSNEGFSLKSGVSKAILDAAGQTVEAECQTLGAQPHPGMIMTQPGNLKCKKILHLAGQTDIVKINKVVKEALQMCVTNSYTSVSFPAIGTGNVQAKQVADAMLDAVIDVLNQNTSSTLKTIRIVIFQPPMLKEFYNSMHEREATDPKDKATGFWGSVGSKIKSLFVGSSDKLQKEEDFVIEALKVDPACFHICGESKTEVDKAKQWINDIISKEHHSDTIADNAILSLSDADQQRIVDIQKTMSVSIRTESKKGQASLTIKGLSKDVLKANNEIHAMLRRARDEEDLKKKVELAGTVVEWTNYELEQALEKNLPSAKVTIQGQVYTVTMPNGPATDNQGRVIEMKRIDKLRDEDIPDNWDAMPANTPTNLLKLPNTGKAECTFTFASFLQLRKRDMELRNGHQNNEKRLFHGTCHDTVAYINNHGFNRSYAGKNAACYGNGTYFAVNASYSASNTYSKPNQNGEKCMYLCRVLTGDFTLGQQNMIVPPAKGAVSVQKYDSVVDNVARPSMYVIFHDTQAYPEYLITFK
uniref:Poly [ADP-ribose] polymerase n=1 Tax=Dicentrarchus labrax TaxID=13489 RepID=A0A8C4EUA4_DICLA